MSFTVHAPCILLCVLPRWTPSLSWMGLAASIVRSTPSAANSPPISASPRTSVFNDLEFLGGSSKWVPLQLSAYLTSSGTGFIPRGFVKQVLRSEDTLRGIFESTASSPVALRRENQSTIVALTIKNVPDILCYIIKC